MPVEIETFVSLEMERVMSLSEFPCHNIVCSFVTRHLCLSIVLHFCASSSFQSVLKSENGRDTKMRHNTEAQKLIDKTIDYIMVRKRKTFYIKLSLTRCLFR